LSFCRIKWVHCRTFFSSLKEHYKLCVSFRDICTFPRTKNKKGNWTYLEKKKEKKKGKRQLTVDLPLDVQIIVEFVKPTCEFHKSNS
jgi:hypothetical protein